MFLVCPLSPPLLLVYTEALIRVIESQTRLIEHPPARPIYLLSFSFMDTPRSLFGLFMGRRHPSIVALPHSLPVSPSPLVEGFVFCFTFSYATAQVFPSRSPYCSLPLFSSRTMEFFFFLQAQPTPFSYSSREEECAYERLILRL